MPQFFEAEPCSEFPSSYLIITKVMVIKPLILYLMTHSLLLWNPRVITTGPTIKELKQPKTMAPYEVQF